MSAVNVERKDESESFDLFVLLFLRQDGISIIRIWAHESHEEYGYTNKSTLTIKDEFMNGLSLRCNLVVHFSLKILICQFDLPESNRKQHHQTQNCLQQISNSSCSDDLINSYRCLIIMNE